MYKEVKGWQGSQRREKEEKRRIEKIDRTFDRQTLYRESLKFMKGVGEMFYWVGREESVGKLVCVGGKARQEAISK